MNRHLHSLTMAAIMAVLTTACASDDGEKAAEPTLSDVITVAEQAWETEQVSLTRSETASMTALKTSGFGLYCSKLSMTNQLVTWHEAEAQWQIGGYPYYLPKYFSKKDLVAYAPYTAEDKVEDGLYTLTIDNDLSNSTDLQWADISGTTPPYSLTFRHALAKLSFGTFTNHYGRSVTLKSITVSEKSTSTGERLYKSGKLDLATGTWIECAEFGDPIKTASLTDFDKETDDDQWLVLERDKVGNIGVAEFLLIPYRTVIVTFTITTTDYGTETFSKEVTLEQGKNTVVSLTLTTNHEVVITE